MLRIPLALALALTTAACVPSQNSRPTNDTVREAIERYQDRLDRLEQRLLEENRQRQAETREREQRDEQRRREQEFAEQRTRFEAELEAAQRENERLRGELARLRDAVNQAETQRESEHRGHAKERSAMHEQIRQLKTELAHRQSPRRETPAAKPAASPATAGTLHIDNQGGTIHIHLGDRAPGITIQGGRAQAKPTKD